MSDWLPIAGQHALVTGGAKRLGAAVALRLADAGLDVTLHCRSSRSDAEAVAEAIRVKGRRAWVVVGDLSDADTARNFIPALGRPVDVLINNASMFEKATLQDLSEENLFENIRMNTLGPFLLSRSLAHQQRPGCIVNFLDAAITGFDAQHVPYHVSKRMLSDLTAMMAVEFAPDIRVNAVAPGLVLPPAGEDETYLEARHDTNLLRRHGSVEGIAGAVLFLLQSGFVTGQTIFVDGGRHLLGRMYG